jgi:hemerythrin-like domain-containing protein
MILEVQIEMILVAHPVDLLKQEHRLIEKVLSALEQKVQNMHRGGFPLEFFQDALDFFANFADACHHFKEEDTLFPLLKQRGIPEEGGPIGCMLHEHGFGRSCLKGIRERLPEASSGSESAQAEIRDYATQYISMLRQHIQKEDNVLFRMAEHVLTGEDKSALQREFTREDNPKINAAVRVKYQALAEKLAAEACG